MVHIVQVVLAGGVEPPQVFADQAQAEAAFVAAAKKYWQQAYAAHCEKTGVDADSFAAAQAFVSGFDLADRSRIHLWSVTPEDGDGSGGEALAKRLEQVRQLVAGMEQAVDGFQSGLAELRSLAGEGDAAEDAGAGTPVLGSAEPSPPPASAASAPPFSEPFPSGFPGLSPSATPASSGGRLPATPKASEPQFNTREWKDYVTSIMQMCGGNRSEYHLFRREAWRQAVYQDETEFEYWDWVAFQIDEHIEQAQGAGYAVIPDPDRPGYYRFRTPDGELSDASVNAEGEAWCRAGVHLAGR